DFAAGAEVTAEHRVDLRLAREPRKRVAAGQDEARRSLGGPAGRDGHARAALDPSSLALLDDDLHRGRENPLQHLFAGGLAESDGGAAAEQEGAPECQEGPSKKFSFHVRVTRPNDRRTVGRAANHRSCQVSARFASQGMPLAPIPARVRAAAVLPRRPRPHTKSQEGHPMRKTSSLLALLAIAFVTVLAPIVWAEEVQGKIKSFDAAGNTVVLEDGTQLMIPPTVRVERQALKPGANVKASYEEKDGHKVATSIAVMPAR